MARRPTGGYSVTIAADDQASATIGKINRQLERLSAPVKKLNQEATRLAGNTGLGLVARGLGNITSLADRASFGVSGLSGPLGAIASGGIVAGFGQIAEAWQKFNSEIQNSSRRIGIAVPRLHALQNAAALSGSSAEEMTSSLRSLRDAMVDAIGGRNPAALMYLERFGISIRDAAGNARSAADVLPELADVIQRLNSDPHGPTLQARILGALGISEGLLPMLREGAAGVRKAEAEGRRLGVTTDEATEEAKALGRAWAELGVSSKGLGLALGDHVAPPLTQVTKDITDLVDSARRLVQTPLSEWFGSATKIETELLGRAPGWQGGPPSSDQSPGPRVVPATPFGVSAPSRTMPRMLGLPQPSGVQGPSEPPTIPNIGQSGDAAQRAGQALAYFMAQGWSKEQAAGIVANLKAESNFNPTIPGDGGRAYGIAQWHPDRQANFQAQFKKPIQQSSYAEQLAFVDWELRNTERRAGDRLRGARTAYEAGSIVSRDYERPRDEEGEASRRGQAADRYARNFIAPPAPVAAPPPPQQAPNGSVSVNISLGGAPPGTVSSVTSTGDVVAPPVRTVRSMPELVY